jgi:hypothetical protein
MSTTRVSFEFKVDSKNLTEAKTKSIEYISKFLEIPSDEVLEKVSIDLKVQTNIELKDSSENQSFNVICYGVHRA